MRPLVLRTIILFSLAAPLRAGHVEVPVGDLGGQGSQAGSAGGVLSAPVPLQLTVPALTGQAVPTLGSALAAAPTPTLLPQAAAARAVATPVAVPALPEPAIPSPKGAAAAPKAAESFEPADSPEAGTDEGRALFDQGGAAKPVGFNRGEGKVSDPSLLPEKIYTPAIMREARRSRRVFELDRTSIKRLEPGVAHNFVIIQYRDGTIGMTVGRLNGVDEVGVKHAALGGGREVLFSGTLRVDPATRRPVLDFNSGVYSMAGLDARWAPTPQNAKALAAHAEAILGTDVDVLDHFQNRAIDFRGGAPSGGLLSKLRGLLPFGEIVPAWPGKAGDAVRIGGVKTALGKHAGDGGTATVWRSRDDQFAIKILHPGARAVPGVEEEAATLRAISKSDLPVAKLVAESRDGGVQVKEFIDGQTAYGLMGRGGFARQHIEGWSELAAMLIRSGITADLAPGNLVWQHWRSRWVIVDAGGLTDGGPASVLKQLLNADALKAGIDPGAFLSGLRARLGPDSAQWAKVRAAINETPELAAFRKSLVHYDVRLAQAPQLSFEPAPKDKTGYDDSVTTYGEIVKRTGYDPMLARSKVKLHGDDPGKLNTQILSVEEPGKRSAVVKIAEWRIIQNEVAGRRLARRFFGRYFRVPASLSVNRGWESFMVMEKLDASPSYYTGAFTLEQRVAAALFIRTFGIGDVNTGNVLTAHEKGGLPWLIDFEQAFGRASPSSGKHIPDERIAMEKPWMSRQVRNRIEDYQPGIKAWRELFTKPETQTAVLADLAAAGYTPAEAAGLLARFTLNVADLDWTLQNDADFVNQFADRNAAHR